MALFSRQAYETRADFGRQRSTLSGIQTRMAGVVSECPRAVVVAANLTFASDTIPGINNILSMIKTRRRRDAIILGCIIGLCIVLLVSYIF